MAKQKVVKVNKKEYTLQSPGYRWYMETVDKNTPRGKSVPKQIKMIDDYLEHVVVDPKVTVEDFENEEKELGGFEALMTLINECETFLTA